MGFLGFGNILGFDHYYGENEYNNNEDFDGSWGIWDEPFMQYMKERLDQKEVPFFSTVFTITSHEPYVIPNKYTGKFPKGSIPMHECVGYTDYAFKEFFKEAQKEPWFENTIFIITSDHGNQVYYGDEYLKVINRNAVPILIYKPDGSLKGENYDLAFIEFSDRGNLFNREKYNEVVNYISEQKDTEDGVAVFVYVHGWKHNASNEKNGDVQNFRKVLKIASETNKSKRKVIGVYVGWRGIRIVSIHRIVIGCNRDSIILPPFMSVSFPATWCWVRGW